MLEDIKKIERRTFRHKFEDGIFEVVSGIIGLLASLYFYGFSLIPKNLIFALMFFLGSILVSLLSVLLGKNMVLSLKQKLSWPRTGYVSYQETTNRRLKAGIRGGIAGFCFPILAGLMEFLFGNPRFYSYPALFGLVFFGLNIWIAFSSGLVRFAILGGICAVIGCFLSLTGWDHLLSMSAFFGSYGILSMLSGWIASRRFLRRYPIPPNHLQSPQFPSAD